jgi:hypothetical protein
VLSGVRQGYRTDDGATAPEGVGDGLGDTKDLDLHVFNHDSLDAGFPQVIRKPNVPVA